VARPPGATVCVAGVATKAKSGGTVPVPVKALVCGEPAALSATDRVAVKLPVADGVKVMAIEQVAEAASASPQVLVPKAKSLALAPASVMAEMERVALPGLLSVKVWAELVVPLVTLPKFAEAGVSVAIGAVGATAAVPVQLKATDSCGSGEGKLTPRFALSAPVAEGVQVMEMVQLAPAARLTPQLLVWLKELMFGPKKPKLLIPCGTPPVLLRVAVWTVLVELTVRLPKLIVAGVRTGFAPCD